MVLLPANKDQKYKNNVRWLLVANSYADYAAPLMHESTGCTHILTLCLPMMKDTFRLQGLIKLDQLVSIVIYSPLRAQNRIGEKSKGCPPYCRTKKKCFCKYIYFFNY